MGSTTFARARRASAAGMTLLEAILALLLLSVCLIPAANALQGALAAPRASSQAALELDCVSSRMEAMLAEPYTRLLAAAGNGADASSFSTEQNAQCPAIKVAITRYGVDRTRALGPAGSGDYLLHVRVELAGATAGNRYPLDTLVTP